MENVLTQLLSGAGSAAGSAASPATAILSGLPELYKLGLGIQQGVQGRRIAKGLVRPTMQVPGSMQDATGLLRLNAMDTRMPGESMLLDQLARNQASLGQMAMNAGGGSAGRLQALVAGQDNANTQLQNIGVQGAQMQLQDIAALANQLNNQANVEQNAWEWNKKDKFTTDAAKAEALQDASRKDIYSGMKGLGGSAAMSMSPPSASTTPPIPQLSDVMKTKPAFGSSFVPDATALPQRGMEFFPTVNPLSNEAAFNAELESIRQIENQPFGSMKTKKVAFPTPTYTPFGVVPPIQQGSIFGKDRGY